MIPTLNPDVTKGICCRREIVTLISSWRFVLFELCTRPDITLSISSISKSRHDSSPGPHGFKRRLVAKSLEQNSKKVLFRPQKRLFCTVSPPPLMLTGWTITLVFWKSNRQSVIVLPLEEAEFVALSACGEGVTWIQRLVYEMVNRTV